MFVEGMNKDEETDSEHLGDQKSRSSFIAELGLTHEVHSLRVSCSCRYARIANL